MYMEKNQPVIEPNFEGEEMKMPSIQTSRPIAPAAANSVLSVPIIILLVLILLAIFGGFYYWYTLVMRDIAAPIDSTRPTAEQNNEPESTTAEARTQTTDVFSTSDEIPAIRADLDSTHLEDLDADLCGAANPQVGSLAV